MIMIIINEVGILRGIMNKKKIQTKMEIMANSKPYLLEWPLGQRALVKIFLPSLNFDFRARSVLVYRKCSFPDICTLGWWSALWELGSITSRCSGKDPAPDTTERRKSSLCENKRYNKPGEDSSPESFDLDSQRVTIRPTRFR